MYVYVHTQRCAHEYSNYMNRTDCDLFYLIAGSSGARVLIETSGLQSNSECSLQHSRHVKSSCQQVWAVPLVLPAGEKLE